MTIPSLTWVLVAAAWGLSALGIVMAVWGLRGDRSRGRRRCPRCWHSLTGVPGLRCPECGRPSKAESHLFRTRRRWRAVVCGALLAVLAVPGYHGANRAKHEGVQGFVPTLLHVALVRYGSASGGASDWSGLGITSNTDGGVSTWSARILVKRVSRDELSSWERSLAWRASRDRIHTDLDGAPPMARSDLERLVSVAAGIPSAARDPRCDDLVTVVLRRPGLAVVGMPLCVGVRAFGFSDEDRLVQLDAGFDEPAPVVTVTTRASQLRWMLRSHSYLPPDVVVSLGRPAAPADGVWVTARMWKRKASTSDDELMTSEPAVVRRVWLPIRIWARGEERLSPVEIAGGPFRSGDARHGAWTLTSELYHPQYLLMPELISELPHDLAVGMRIEILIGDAVVFRARGCMWQDQSSTTYPWGRTDPSPFHNMSLFVEPVSSVGMEDKSKPAMSTVQVPALEPGRYVARITGDEEMAWWHPGAREYWAGELIVPVYVEGVTEPGWPE